MIEISSKDKQRNMAFVYGKLWNKSDFNWFSFNKSTLGWAVNVWRFAVYYDNWARFN